MRLRNHPELSTRWTAWSISSVVTPGFTMTAAMSRTSLASCVKDGLGLELPTHTGLWDGGRQSHLGHHSHGLDVLRGEDPDLRRSLQELLRLGRPCGGRERRGHRAPSADASCAGSHTAPAETQSRLGGTVHV